jgi:hypothetical protein
MCTSVFIFAHVRTGHMLLVRQCNLSTLIISTEAEPPFHARANSIGRICIVSGDSVLHLLWYLAIATTRMRAPGVTYGLFHALCAAK